MIKELSAYRKRRNFQKTKEPVGKKKPAAKKKIFVVQKHYATHLHYDFRLQIGGALKSWAIPKGPSKSEKRLAMLTEDHPLEYANFHGTIPEGNYGAGRVEIWDKGTFVNIKKDKKGKEVPLKKCFQKGQLEVFLKGKKLKGAYALINFKDKRSWLFFKMKKRIDVDA